MSETRSEYLQETKRHGSVLFPFNIYPCTIPRDFPSVALHWHKSMELVYVKRGRGQVQAGMCWLDASEGDVFILPPGMLHALRGVPECAMEYENIIFDPEFLGAGAADICAQRYLVPLAAGRLPLPVCLRGRARVAAHIARRPSLAAVPLVRCFSFLRVKQYFFDIAALKSAVTGEEFKSVSVERMVACGDLQCAVTGKINCCHKH